MATLFRYQNPVLGDTLNLDFYAFNNNRPVDVQEFDRVDIYFLDPAEITTDNTDGRIIKASVSASNIQQVETGHYRLPVLLTDTLYQVGNYVDIWYAKYNSDDPDFYPVENQFKVFTSLRETHGEPFVYDVDFKFSPKKVVKGTKRYLTISFRPVVHTDIGDRFVEEEILDRFYYSLRSTGNVYIRLELFEGCGYSTNPYMNIKTDPEWTPIEIRGDNEAYYLLDVTEDQDDFDIGVYWAQFKVEIQGQTIISPKFYLQIYD